VTTRPGLADILGHPLVIALLLAGFSGYGGYVTGQATTQGQLLELRNRMEKVEQTQGRRTQFLSCSARFLDRLQDKVNINPPCPLIGE